ncbi:glycosyltransferase [Hafnia psychrotolerans]|uniref:Mannosyltransferase A n=1 Tax=Hafnia psychrotolerans TaxID=1477018 RepID=A0ABQ1G1G0_9GAMM|nr:glycosyltransferase [Hafnia psychrotolerans]GGA34810.1 mannosyltransferase A [Hafnia psychrotolerans]
MRVLIDMQAMQTSSTHRGIGRYTAGLVKNMLELNTKHEVLLLLNGLLAESVDYIRQEFRDLVLSENIHVFSGIGPVYYLDEKNTGKRLAMEKVREDFISKLKPDVVLVSSLFEGFGDNALTSISSYKSIPTAVILYDLIPLIHSHIYLENESIKKWYLKKIDHLKRSELLLSISESAGNEAIRYLSIPEEKVFNISTACDERFMEVTVTDGDKKHLKTKYGITGPFIMYTGGIDHRKNIEGLIRAYSNLSDELINKYQLTIVCSVQEHDRQRLTRLYEEHGLTNSNVVITGFVSDEDLLILYNYCELFVFPSWHEGFGLPILEAMKCGKPVIGGELSSIPEVIGIPEPLFDPFNDHDITLKINKALTDPEYNKLLKNNAYSQSHKFSWEITAKKTWESLENLHIRHLKTNFLKSNKRPRMAFLSPLPPEKSGISDYSVELLHELSKYYDIDVIVEQKNNVSDPYVISNFTIRDPQWLRDNSSVYERVLYNFGNSDFHGHMFDLLEDIPGIVVLHDFFLSGIVSHLDVGIKQKPNFLADELLKYPGWGAVKRRFLEESALALEMEYPCNLSVLQNSLGVISHSEYSKSLALKLYGEKAAIDWFVIPLLRSAPSEITKEEARAKLGLNNSSFVVCSFGFLNPTKLNHRLLEAWGSSALSESAECHLIFVGQNDSGEYGQTIIKLIKNKKNKSTIKITGWVSAEDYKTWLAAADVGVQLRTSSRGETSASVLDCLNYGLATIVNANGSMDDLDNNIVWKMDDEFTDEDFLLALNTLYKDYDRRTEMQKKGKDKVYRENNPRDCALKCFQTIENVYASASLNYQGLLKDIACDDRYDISDSYEQLAVAISQNYEPSPRLKQVYVDISGLLETTDTIEYSYVQKIMNTYLEKTFNHWNLNFVFYSKSEDCFFNAKKFTSNLIGISDGWTDDTVMETWVNDVFVSLYPSKCDGLKNDKNLLTLKRMGVKTYSCVHLNDLSSDEYLQFIEKLDGILITSWLVAEEFELLKMKSKFLNQIKIFTPSLNEDSSNKKSENPEDDIITLICQSVGEVENV